MIKKDEAILIDLVESILEKVGSNIKNITKIMLSSASLIKMYFPELGKEAYSVAENYWLFHRVDVDTLEKKRIECWEYIDKLPKIEDNKLEISSLRALICLLYPNQTDADSGEILLNFLEFLAEILDINVIENNIKSNFLRQ